MLDIKALEAAFARIGEIGKGEIDVEVDGVRVWMRALVPEEDIEVQKYARGDSEGGIENLLLIERYKRATIAYAVVQVGGLDLRGVTHIPTGEVLENGNPVRVPKVIAVRRIVDGWSRQATTLLFQRYAELVRRIEDEANAKVQFDKSNLPAEIERLESRLADLRRVQAGTVIPTGITTEIVQQIDEETKGYSVVPPTASSDTRASVITEPAPNPVPKVADPPAQPRARVAPSVAPPPARVETPPLPTPSASRDPLPNVLNSFGDATDEAIAAETARIVSARARVAQAQAQAEAEAEAAHDLPGDVPEPVPVPVRMGRTPPHVAAARVAQEVIDPLAAAEAIEPVGDVPAFRMPSTNITDRGRKPNVPAPPQVGGARGIGQRVPGSAVNKMPSGTPNNPNFRGGGNR